jgi:hypothetical protein
VFSLGFLACGDQIKINHCSGGDFDGAVSRISAVDPDWSRASVDDHQNISVPLLISAEAPCLLGGLTATATTSIGTIGEKEPGTAASVVLSPQGDRLAGVLTGEVQLVMPGGRSCRVEIMVADSDRIERIEVPDGGIDAGSTDPSDDDAGAKDGAADGS